MNTDDLQAKLDGVYDLTKVSDCHVVLQVLLDNADRERQRADFSEIRLGDLAKAVINDRTEDAKDIASKVMKSHLAKRRSPEEVVEFLIKMSERMTTCESMEDAKLVDEALRVWGEFPMDSRESAVIDELLLRFRKAKGLVDDGEQHNMS